MGGKKYLVVGVLALAAAITKSAGAQEKTPPTPKTVSIDQALSAFLTAFDNLDWPNFRACFDEGATIFHPSAPNVKRIDSPDQFDKAWLGVFERIKKSSGRSSPPYLSLEPLDLRVQTLSEDVTLVTFHLVDGSTVNRRTLIFKRNPNGWKIIHIHASNITLP